MCHYVTLNPVSTAQLWSESAKKQVVPMLKPFEDYNKQIGGVDLFDQFVSTYRVCIRSKKWWWPFFAWAVNTSVANAWNLFHTIQKEKTGMLEFQREVVMSNLASFGRNKPEKVAGFSTKWCKQCETWYQKSHPYERHIKINTVVVDQSIYARNAILPSSLTVSRTIICETQSLLYFLSYQKC